MESNEHASSSSGGEQIEADDDCLAILIALFKKLQTLSINDDFLATTVDEIIKERDLSKFFKGLSKIQNEIGRRNGQPQDDVVKYELCYSRVLEGVFVKRRSESLRMILQKFLNLYLEDRVKNPETSYLSTEFLCSFLMHTQQDRTTEGAENPNHESSTVSAECDSVNPNEMQEVRNEDSPQDQDAKNHAELSAVPDEYCDSINPNDAQEAKFEDPPQDQDAQNLAESSAVPDEYCDYINPNDTQEARFEDPPQDQDVENIAESSKVPPACVSVTPNDMQQGRNQDPQDHVKNPKTLTSNLTVFVSGPRFRQRDRKTENPNESSTLVERSQIDMQEARNEDPPQGFENLAESSSTGPDGVSGNGNDMEQSRNTDPQESWPTLLEAVSRKVKKRGKLYMN